MPGNQSITGCQFRRQYVATPSPHILRFTGFITLRRLGCYHQTSRYKTLLAQGRLLQYNVTVTSQQ